MGKEVWRLQVSGVKQQPSVASSRANAVEAKAGPTWLKRVGRTAGQCAIVDVVGPVDAKERRESRKTAGLSRGKKKKKAINSDGMVRRNDEWEKSRNQGDSTGSEIAEASNSLKRPYAARASSIWVSPSVLTLDPQTSYRLPHRAAGYSMNG